VNSLVCSLRCHLSWGQLLVRSSVTGMNSTLWIWPADCARLAVIIQGTQSKQQPFVARSWAMREVSSIRWMSFTRCLGKGSCDASMLQGDPCQKQTYISTTVRFRAPCYPGHERSITTSCV